MNHTVSSEDHKFKNEIECCAIQLAEFDHRAHISLAYIYIAQYGVDLAHKRMKSSLLRLLRHNNIDTANYSETITKAWIMAVRHFMELSNHCGSSADFIRQQARMLDANIMLSHYSAEILFSDYARSKFVVPDIEAIPQYAS